MMETTNILVQVYDLFFINTSFNFFSSVLDFYCLFIVVQHKVNNVVKNIIVKCLKHGEDQLVKAAVCSVIFILI